MEPTNNHVGRSLIFWGVAVAHFCVKNAVTAIFYGVAVFDGAADGHGAAALTDTVTTAATIASVTVYGEPRHAAMHVAKLRPIAGESVAK